MQRIEQIIHHPIYLDHINRLKELEKKRRFCKHDWAHFLDVARIAWLLCLERGLPYSKELVYAAALLHDIGRVKEYEEQTPHERASLSFARKILEDCAFDCDECHLILSGIQCHNQKSRCQYNPFAAMLFEADKRSRLCFACDVSEECKWSEEERNKTIIY